jgi:hypothetical protein
MYVCKYYFKVKHRFEWEYLTVSTNLSCCFPYMYLQKKKYSLETDDPIYNGKYYFNITNMFINIEDLDDPAVSALRHAIAKVEQRWSVIALVTKNLLSQAPPCFGKHFKPLVPAAFAVISRHHPALGQRGGL